MVVLNGVTSFFLECLKWSTPGLGSGPLLFIIYINGIDGLTNKILTFADDTKLFGVVTNGDDVEKMRADL